MRAWTMGRCALSTAQCRGVEPEVFCARRIWWARLRSALLGGGCWSATEGRELASGLEGMLESRKARTSVRLGHNELLQAHKEGRGTSRAKKKKGDGDNSPSCPLAATMCSGVLPLSSCTSSSAVRAP